MLNSSNRCDTCNGRVRNIDGKRHSIPRLAEIHAQSCPGPKRKK